MEFLKKRTTLFGDVYALYRASDGQRIEVLIRHGWRVPYCLTPREAREAAIWRLTAKPGSVRLAVDDGRWHVYERTDGTQYAVPARGRRGLTLTEAQTRQIAEQALEEA